MYCFYLTFQVKNNNQSFTVSFYLDFVLLINLFTSRRPAYYNWQTVKSEDPCFKCNTLQQKVPDYIIDWRGAGLKSLSNSRQILPSFHKQTSGNLKEESSS